MSYVVVGVHNKQQWLLFSKYCFEVWKYSLQLSKVAAILEADTEGDGDIADGFGVALGLSIRERIRWARSADDNVVAI